MRSCACSMFEIVLKCTNCIPRCGAGSVLLTDCYGAFALHHFEKKKSSTSASWGFFWCNSPGYPSCVCCSRAHNRWWRSTCKYIFSSFTGSSLCVWFYLGRLIRALAAALHFTLDLILFSSNPAEKTCAFCRSHKRVVFVTPVLVSRRGVVPSWGCGINTLSSSKPPWFVGRHVTKCRLPSLLPQRRTHGQQIDDFIGRKCRCTRQKVCWTLADSPVLPEWLQVLGSHLKLVILRESTCPQSSFSQGLLSPRELHREFVHIKNPGAAPYPLHKSRSEEFLYINREVSPFFNLKNSGV